MPLSAAPTAPRCFSRSWRRCIEPRGARDAKAGGAHARYHCRAPALAPRISAPCRGAGARAAADRAWHLLRNVVGALLLQILQGVAKETSPRRSYTLSRGRE